MTLRLWCSTGVCDITSLRVLTCLSPRRQNLLGFIALLPGQHSRYTIYDIALRLFFARSRFRIPITLGGFACLHADLRAQYLQGQAPVSPPIIRYECGRVRMDRTFQQVVARDVAHLFRLSRSYVSPQFSQRIVTAPTSFL